MLEMSWIAAISKLYNQVTYLSEIVILKRIKLRLLDLLTRCYYILIPPSTKRSNIVIGGINNDET